ncbi:hypothetical protein ACFO4E_09145 [Nocardiopsis mangrovi]|uniref:Uncharacterized protein n=1 Tax=Nocardiopsis mangrovi TaxID=1179818 RepID=A0ABV9DT15_9ACTN
MNIEPLNRLRLPAAWILLGAVGAQILGGLIDVFGTTGVGGSIAGSFAADGSAYFFSPVLTALVLAAVALVITAPQRSSVNFPVVLIGLILTGLSALLAVVTLIMGFVYAGEINEIAGGFGGMFAVGGQLAIVIFAGLFQLRVLNDQTLVPRSAPVPVGQQPFAPHTGAQQSFAPQQPVQGYAPTGGQAAYQPEWGAQQAQQPYADPAQTQQPYADPAQAQQAYADPAHTQQPQQQVYADPAQPQQPYADPAQQGQAYAQGWPQEAYRQPTGAQEPYQQQHDAYQQGYHPTGGQQAYGATGGQQAAAYGQEWQQGQQQAQAGYDPYGAAQQAHQQQAQQPYGSAYEPAQQPAPAEQRPDTPTEQFYAPETQQAADTPGQAGGQYGAGAGYGGESYGSDQHGQAGSTPSGGQQGWYRDDDRR